MGRRIISDEDVETARQLAAAGAGVRMIAEHLHISETSFRRHGKLKEAVREGRKVARVRALKLFNDRLAIDPAFLFDAVKRLGVHLDPIPLPKPSNPKEATETMAQAFELWTRGDITQNQLRTIEAWCNSYTKLYEVAELEPRLEELERMLDADQR